MRIKQSTLLLLVLYGSGSQDPPKKHLLVVGEERVRHGSVLQALPTIERRGEKTVLWDITIRTDPEATRKKKLEFNAKNLDDFDAVLFFTGGELEMDAQQKAGSSIFRPR